MSKEFTAQIVYEFIKDCIPKKDFDILKDAIANRAAWNCGTAEFAVSRIDKHYRKIAEKILSEVDSFTERNGPVDYSKGAVE